MNFIFFQASKLQNKFIRAGQFVNIHLTLTILVTQMSFEHFNFRQIGKNIFILLYFFTNYFVFWENSSQFASCILISIVWTMSIFWVKSSRDLNWHVCFLGKKFNGTKLTFPSILFHSLDIPSPSWHFRNTKKIGLNAVTVIQISTKSLVV